MKLEKNLQGLLLLLQNLVGSSKTVNNSAIAMLLLSQMPENKSKHYESQKILLFVKKYDLKSGVIVGNHDEKLEAGGKNVMNSEMEMNSRHKTLSSLFFNRVCHGKTVESLFSSHPQHQVLSKHKSMKS